MPQGFLLLFYYPGVEGKFWVIPFIPFYNSFTLGVTDQCGNSAICQEYLFQVHIQELGYNQNIVEQLGPQ